MLLRDYHDALDKPPTQYPRHKWPKSWSEIEDPVVPLERNLYGHTACWPLVGQFEEVLGLGWEEVPKWECLLAHRKQGLFLSVHVDDIKMAETMQNMAPMSKKLIELVDLDEPTSFLDHVYLGCTQRECEPNEDIVNQCREMFESRISATAAENYQDGRNLTQQLSRGPTTWKVLRKSAFKGIVSWQTKRQSSCTKFQLLAWTTIISRRRNWNQLENGQKYAHRLT